MTTNRESRDVVSALFGKEIRCTMDDGRTVRGKLICLDRLRNMILRDVVELRLLPQHLQRPHLLEGVAVACPSTAKRGVAHAHVDNYSERRLAHAMIPGKHLVKVEVDESLWRDLCQYL
jgi:small nuclear ribonucleoprotein (snRNP)-like protein